MFANASITNIEMTRKSDGDAIAGNVMVITNQCEHQSDFSETRGNKPVTIDMVGYMIESQNALLCNEFKSAAVSTIAHCSEMLKLIAIIIITIVISIN